MGIYNTEEKGIEIDIFKADVSKRKEVKELIKEMKKTNKNVDYNIFKALDNINLNCVLGTKRDGKYKSFLEDYDK